MNINKPILPVEAIQERDIDLLLLEEFYTDDDFCNWFINELKLPSFSGKIGVWRSITDFGLGETDLLFSYNSENIKISVLIENKLDASFQDEQFNRYIKRAEEYIEKGIYDKTFVVLIAPQLYCLNQNYFENYISYESISDRLIFTGSKRNLFKSQLLKIASEKLRRGYQPINSEIVQKFWMDYWHYKEQNFPSLEMKKPSIIPFNSDWPMLLDKRIKNIQFFHKLSQGNIDATFKGLTEELANEIKTKLPKNATLVKHSKSFSIRIYIGKIDRTKDFSSQVSIIDESIKNIELLRNWILNSNFF
jgi:hypothetical protein